MPVIKIFILSSFQQEKNFYDQDIQLRQIVGKEIDLNAFVARIYEDTERRVRLCKRIFPQGARILDFGCGYGYFVKRMREEGYDAVGLDLGRERVERGRKEFNVPLIEGDIRDTTNKEFLDGSFDGVTLFHVLEHLAQPDEVLQAVHGKLKTEGIMIAELPSGNDYLLNFSPYARFVYQEAHCAYYVSSHIRSMLLRNGFCKIKIKNLQRYSIKNALHWLLKRKPQLEYPSYELSHPLLRLIDRGYKKIIQWLGKNDTLFVIAVK